MLVQDQKFYEKWPIAIQIKEICKLRILAIIKYKSIQLFHGRASLASQNFVILHKKIENIASFMNDPDAFYKFKLKVIEEINKIGKKSNTKIF